MGRSPGFASTTCDLFALLRLAFATASRRNRLTLPQMVTRRFIMQKARSQPGQFRRITIGLLLLVSAWFQVLFIPLEGVLFIIWSPYWSTIGRQVVLSLKGWSPYIHTEFHELRATLERLGGSVNSHTGLSPCVV